MDNPEKLATLATQDDGAIKDGQSRETGNIGYTRCKTKTNKTKNTTQYVLDTTIHKTQDEDKKPKNPNTICVRHYHTQDTRRRQKTKKPQHNMC